MSGLKIGFLTCRCPGLTPSAGGLVKNACQMAGKQSQVFHKELNDQLDPREFILAPIEMLLIDHPFGGQEVFIRGVIDAGIDIIVFSDYSETAMQLKQNQSPYQLLHPMRCREGALVAFLQKGTHQFHERRGDILKKLAETKQLVDLLQVRLEIGLRKASVV